MQVQSKVLTGQVKQLTYMRRGLYKMVKIYPSGSYKLESLYHSHKQNIKKHDSDILFCPKKLIPYEQINMSDKNFSIFNK